MARYYRGLRPFFFIVKRLAVGDQFETGSLSDSGRQTRFKQRQIAAGCGEAPLFDGEGQGIQPAGVITSI